MMGKHGAPWWSYQRGGCATIAVAEHARWTRKNTNEEAQGYRHNHKGNDTDTATTSWGEGGLEEPADVLFNTDTNTHDSSQDTHTNTHMDTHQQTNTHTLQQQQQQQKRFSSDELEHTYARTDAQTHCSSLAVTS